MAVHTLVQRRWFLQVDVVLPSARHLLGTKRVLECLFDILAQLWSIRYPVYARRRNVLTTAIVSFCISIVHVSCRVASGVVRLGLWLHTRRAHQVSPSLHHSKTTLPAAPAGGAAAAHAGGAPSATRLTWRRRVGKLQLRGTCTIIHGIVCADVHRGSFWSFVAPCATKRGRCRESAGG